MISHVDIGTYRVVTLDPSIDNSGVCCFKIDVDFDGPNFLLNKYKLLRSSGTELFDKVVSIGNAFCNIVNEFKATRIIIEFPSITSYDTRSINFVIKRLGDVRKIIALIYYIYGRLGTNFHYVEIQPSQWQDKAMIRKCGNSKSWSCQFATRIANTAIENHNIADAICISYVVYSIDVVNRYKGKVNDNRKSLHI